MVKRVFVCPNCGEISDEVGMSILEKVRATYYMSESDFVGDDVETVDVKYYCIWCGFELSGDISDYSCYLDDEGGVVEPDGAYWINHVDDLREFVGRFGFRVGYIPDKYI